MKCDNQTTDFHKRINSTRQTERLTVDHSGPHVWRGKDILSVDFDKKSS